MEKTYHHFTHIYSTNTWALQNYPSFKPECLTIITADEQSLGRGRFNRQWKSPPGVNIYLTFAFFMEDGRKDIGNTSQILALTCAELLHIHGLYASIKWPNDIMIGEKKIGGILTETKSTANGLLVVMGIGLNVNMTGEELSAIDQPATSVAVELGQDYSIERLRTALVDAFDLNLHRFLEEGFVPFLDIFGSRLLIDKPVRYSDGRQEWKGTILSFNKDGSLTIMLEDGSQKICYSGEILQ